MAFDGTQGITTPTAAPPLTIVKESSPPPNRTAPPPSADTMSSASADSMPYWKILLDKWNQLLNWLRSFLGSPNQTQAQQKRKSETPAASPDPARPLISAEEKGRLKQLAQSVMSSSDPFTQRELLLGEKWTAESLMYAENASFPLELRLSLFRDRSKSPRGLAVDGQSAGINPIDEYFLQGLETCFKKEGQSDIELLRLFDRATNLDPRCDGVDECFAKIHPQLDAELKTHQGSIQTVIAKKEAAIEAERLKKLEGEKRLQYLQLLRMKETPEIKILESIKEIFEAYSNDVPYLHDCLSRLKSFHHAIYEQIVYSDFTDDEARKSGDAFGYPKLFSPNLAPLSQLVSNLSGKRNWDQEVRDAQLKCFQAVINGGYGLICVQEIQYMIQRLKGGKNAASNQ